MKTLIALFCVVLFVESSFQKSTPEDDYYMAGVVEFSSKDKRTTTDTPAAYTSRTLTKYMELINSTEADQLDILVFPEYTLNDIETATFVPNPFDEIAPCNHLLYDPIVRDLSCLATIRKLYLVVNLVEKAHCPEGYDWRACADNGLYHFNTNVVFDRQGVVIARYRKHTLFDEPGINTTIFSSRATFQTDFGVEFGTITSFDILFDDPAMELIRSGVTDIILPAMWISGLSFHTGVQVQQAWAYRNNVNLLAAGASYPEVGSTGTGVYAGKRGRIVSVMNHNAETKLYVASVPKIDRPQAEVRKQPVIKYSPAQMSNLKMLRDPIDGYTTVELPLTKNDQFEASLCHDRVCCNFTIDYELSAPITTQQFYRYRLAAFDGARSFQGFAEARVTVCAVLACTGTTLASCGTRFESGANSVPMVVFNSIELKETVDLEGSFLGEQTYMVLPTSLDTSILPLEVDEFEYSERDVTTDGKLIIETTHKLVKPRSDLYSFAIWGREVVQEFSSGAFSPMCSACLMFAAALFAIVLNNFN
ncbi:hypothetical protein quinque_006267 [Culex quinquefasciatus]